MGRSDSYRCELLAHPGWSKGAARYDDGLLAHSDKRPALTDASPERSPCPELRSLPSPDLPVQRRHLPHRHTRYDAYGACTVLDADGSADADGLSDVKNPYLFTGRRVDLESALMQYRNRYYAPGLGRFVSRDMLEYVDSAMLYEFCLSLPTGMVDPSGRAIWQWPGQGVELLGKGISGIGDLSGNIPVFGGVTQRVINVPGNLVQGAGNLLQGNLGDAGGNVVDAGRNLIETPGATLNSLWQAPQNLLGMGYAGLNAGLSGLGLWSNFRIRHYEVTCCIDGMEVTQEIWVVEGPIPEISNRGVCLGQVIHVGTGLGRLPPGRTLSHEAGHCVGQSALMGPSYLLNIVTEYLIEGYENSYFEADATEVGKQCRIRRK